MRFALLLPLLVALGAPALGRPAEAGEAYVFAVVPQGPPVVVSALWAPIVERISAGARVPLRLKLYERVEDLQTDLATGAVDLAYVNPVQAVRGFQAARYRPLVRNERPIRGVFFVERDSPVDSVASLAGREVAFVGPWSVCSVTLRHEAKGVGIVPRYVGTSANAYKNVILGLTSAGGVLDVILDDAPREVREKLRVIYRTPPMAPHTIVVHPRVPGAEADRIAAALKALAETETGAQLLGRVHLEVPVDAEYGRDYAPLEHLLDGPAEVGTRRPE